MIYERAERLLQKLQQPLCYENIDELVKEMVGETE